MKHAPITAQLQAVPAQIAAATNRAGQVDWRKVGNPDQICRAGDDATKDAIAVEMVRNYRQRIAWALVQVHSADLPAFKKRFLAADLERKREIIKQIVGDGYSSAAHILGMLTTHKSGIDHVLSDVSRAVGKDGGQ